MNDLCILGIDYTGSQLRESINYKKNPDPICAQNFHAVISIYLTVLLERNVALVRK